MVLEIYNAKLSKRLERRKFVFERGFLEYKKVHEPDSNLPYLLVLVLLIVRLTIRISVLATL